MTEKKSIIDSEKRSIRQKISDQRKLLTPDEIEDRSRKIEKNLLSLSEYKTAKRIMFYVSKVREVDTHKIIEDFLKSKKHVVVPVTQSQDKTLSLCEIESFPVGLHRSTYGVLEPELGDRCHLYTKEIDLIIVPGVAFDRNGHRLGHGGGYYDRFLKTMNPKIPRIALAFDFQILPKIPREIWDMPVDRIVTESEVITIR